MRELSFLQVVSLLRDERVQRVVASFREPNVALIRLIILVVTIPYLLAQGQAAHPEVRAGAQVAIFATLGWICVCGVWWLFVRGRRNEASLRDDTIGLMLDAAIAFSLLKLAFIPLIFLNSFWPLILARISALFPRRVFVASTVATLILMLAAAPGYYWFQRPAYFIYGAVVNIVLPLTMDRIFTALRAAALQAVLSQQAQLRFIGAMSHELRTPLNAVINASALMAPERLDPEDRELFGLVTTNADTLLDRVNSVLDLAAIGAGKLQVTPAPTSMRAILKSVFAACAPSAAESGISLVDDRIGPEDAVILADAGRVNQVLINLVGNAIKFTPPGGRITVKTALGSGDGRLEMRCSVADSGSGVPDAAKEAIFEAFHQAAETTQTSRGGIGLGLHIARTLTERMGGTLSVRDNPGGGALFEVAVSFPLAPEGTVLRPSTSVSSIIDAHRAGRHHLRVLVVDDQDSNRRVMRAMLERGGHEVMVVDSVDAGLASMRVSEFDVVMLDLNLPGRSGFDLLDALASEPALKGHATLVVVSADTGSSVVEAARAKGAAAFLAKPVSPAAMFDVLTSVSTKGARVELTPRAADDSLRVP